MTYSKEQIAAALDLAVLTPAATQRDVAVACDLANKHQVASICVPPALVGFAAKHYHNVSAVIGFPDGDASPERKFYEAILAIRTGAKELDVVLNHRQWRLGDQSILISELAGFARIARSHDVKVKAIIEACHSGKSLAMLAQLCASYRVDWVKSNTGVNGEADPECIMDILEGVKGTATRVKASGGIKTYERAAMYLSMGCTRLGSSRCEDLFP